MGIGTCSVIGTDVGERVLTPLYSRLYSQAGPDFTSENAEARKAISFVSHHIEKRGIWVLDRGGDRARHVLKAARRLFGIPDFRFYTLADGIRELLFSHQKGLEGLIKMLRTETIQLKLFNP